MINGPVNGGDHLKELAERIAQLISSESGSSDIARLQASLEQINSRLERLELAMPRIMETAPLSTHASQDRFQIPEAGIEPLNGNSEDKVCPFEPGGKPCDHCSMCSSRGF